MPTMMPLMDKDTVRYITQNITPEEAEYVAGIKSTIDDTKIMETKPELCDDVIYLTKIIAFATKFKTCDVLPKLSTGLNATIFFITSLIFFSLTCYVNYDSLMLIDLLYISSVIFKTLILANIEAFNLNISFTDV